MGNNNSKTINYDLDTEIVNTKQIIENKKVEKLNDYDKLFITYNNKKDIYGILIKVINNKLYIYLKNISNNDFNLVQIVVLSKYINVDIKNYINYIYISREYDIISIPEYDMINIYSLSELVNNNNLKQINKTGLNIKLNDNKFILFNKNIIVSEVEPYKCYLCRDMFVIILILENCYNKIIGIDYKNDKMYTIDSINIPLNTSILQLLNNVCILYDYNRNSIYTSNIKSPMKKRTIRNNIEPNTLCLSDDGKIFFYISNNNEKKQLCFSVYSISNSKCYDNKINKNNINIDLEKTKFKLLNYNKIKDIAIRNNYNIYVLSGWNIEEQKVYYWFIKYNDNECIIHNARHISMNIKDDIKYNYNNRFLYVFKTVNGLIKYDLENILPIKVADIMKNDILKQINTFYKNNKHNKNRYVNIKCADNKTRRYELNNIMSFFIEEQKDRDVYDVDYTVNIDIYNNNKSFDIFQKLLEGNKNIDSVIMNIFNIDGTTNKYNIMSDLLDHIYEYTKKIVINSDNNINELKAYYIGYVLMIFILKFYTYFVKKHNIGINKDIINTFNLNYPPFSEFMNNSVDSLI